MDGESKIDTQRYKESEIDTQREKGSEIDAQRGDRIARESEIDRVDWS